MTNRPSLNAEQRREAARQAVDRHVIERGFWCSGTADIAEHPAFDLVAHHDRTTGTFRIWCGGCRARQTGIGVKEDDREQDER